MEEASSSLSLLSALDGRVRPGIAIGREVVVVIGGGGGTSVRRIGGKAGDRTPSNPAFRASALVLENTAAGRGE